MRGYLRYFYLQKHKQLQKSRFFFRFRFDSNSNPNLFKRYYNIVDCNTFFIQTKQLNESTLCNRYWYGTK